MRKVSSPHLPARGVEVASLGLNRTKDVPPEIRERKQTKVEIAEAFEDAGARAASIAKATRGGVEVPERETSHSHDRPFEVKRSRGAGARRDKRLGVLADPMLTQRVDEDPRRDEAVDEEVLSRIDVQGRRAAPAAKAVTAG